MLVSKGYDKDEIISFKLVNGDEIIARLVDQDDENFIIYKPCTIVPSQQGLGLVQSLFTGDLNNNISLDKSHVMMTALTIKDVQSHYIKTTTGIEPVTSGGIIT